MTSLCYLQRTQGLPAYLRIVLSTPGDPTLRPSFRSLFLGWKNPNKMLSAQHCNGPSKKEGHCLLCDNSLFSQTMNQPHCPTRLCVSFILFITANGKSRNTAKKENTRPQYLILLVKRESGFHSASEK